MIKLKAREELFAQEYIVDFSAMAAAIRAGYAYSTAKNASEWIHPEHPTKPRVRARIDELIAQKSRRLGVTQERVMESIAQIAFGNPADAVDMKTAAVRKDAAPEDLAMISSLKIAGGKDGFCEVRFHDRLKAAELLGRSIGMFDDRARREAGMQGSVQRVAEIMARLDAESAEASNGLKADAAGKPEDECAEKEA